VSNHLDDLLCSTKPEFHVGPCLLLSGKEKMSTELTTELLLMNFLPQRFVANTKNFVFEMSLKKLNGSIQ